MEELREGIMNKRLNKMNPKLIAQQWNFLTWYLLLSSFIKSSTRNHFRTVLSNFILSLGSYLVSIIFLTFDPILRTDYYMIRESARCFSGHTLLCTSSCVDLLSPSPETYHFFVISLWSSMSAGGIQALFLSFLWLSQLSTESTVHPSLVCFSLKSDTVIF